MKKMIILAAFAFAALATPAMAQSKVKVKQDGTTERVVSGPEGKNKKGMRDPKKRTAKLAEKLNFTDAQKAQLSSLNTKYPGTDFDRKAYHQEFRAILTDAQKQQLADIRAKHKANREKRGEKKA